MFQTTKTFDFLSSKLLLLTGEATAEREYMTLASHWFEAVEEALAHKDINTLHVITEFYLNSYNDSSKIVKGLSEYLKTSPKLTDNVQNIVNVCINKHKKLHSCKPSSCVVIIINVLYLL